MPIPSPFHDRTSPLCESYQWKNWAGYHAACRYLLNHEPEYHALRHASGLIDVTPLFKYEIRGKDASRLLHRMMVRDHSRLKVGRVAYTCWCDDAGKVIDDGTVAHLSEHHYRLTAAEPTFRWLEHLSRHLDVQIEDSSRELAVLALQGPTARDLLQQLTSLDLSYLRYFSVAQADLDGIPVSISRTGYTGDLGYEIWTATAHALRLWDCLIHTGTSYGLLPAGLDALDMVRIEAGYIMLDVDYYSAQKEILESRKSTPSELGLGWMVQLDRDPFVGQRALREEAERGAAWALLGLDLSWEEIEALYDNYGLPPSLPATASRHSLPVYSGDRQVGYATSHTWSPLLKKSVALASVRADFSDPLSHLKIEQTVEHERYRVSARIVDLPFFDPERKRKL